MKKSLSILCLLIVAFFMSACTQSEIEQTTQTAATVKTEQTSEEATEGKDMNKITVTVGESEFTATLYDNEAAREFKSRLPLTLDMEELNGNEKYFYLDSALPTSSAVTEGIKSGDIKLFGSDCLVLFYEDFKTQYSYTDIGGLDDAEGLKEALGNAGVKVTFAP